VTGVGEEDTHLAIVEFAQAATPLAGYAARLLPLFREAGGVENKDRLGIGQFRADMVAEFLEDGTIVPSAGTDEQLQGAALLAGLGGNGFGGLALQASELAAEDSQGVPALFLAVEKRQVALGEGGEVRGAGRDGCGGKFGVGEQGLGLGM